MKYTINGTVMQTANFELKQGEKIFSESGGMAWMSDNIKMETSSRGGLIEGVKRKLSGESIFLNTFTCIEGTGVITFASEFPGKILALDIKPGKEIICQKDAFMCAEDSVEIKMHFRKRLGAGFFGGEGFILQEISGKGTAFVELGGEITKYTLKEGQTLLVDTGHIAMYEPTVDFDIQLIHGAKNILFGGEGLFLAVLKGPGTVWLQSMPLNKLAGKIGQYLATGSEAGGTRRGIGSIFDSFGSGI